MKEVNDDLLVKFLLKETSPEENLEVIRWAEADSANQKLLADMELIWTTSKNLSKESKVDENEAWDKFKVLTQSRQAKKEAIVKPMWRNNFIRNIAAILLLTTGIWALYSKVLYPTANLTSNDSVLIETLPDGSEVTLNKHTQLSYSSPIGQNKRLVKLEHGEVFFNVSHNKAKPFVIQANGVTVQVVGTSFNVIHDSKFTEVIVETGIVKITQGSQSIELRKGEKAKLIDGQTFKAEPVNDQLYNYYRTNEFIADNTPLWRLVEVLNHAYKSNIVIANPALQNVTITTTFNNESLDRILEIVSATSSVPMKIEKSGNTIILK